MLLVLQVADIQDPDVSVTSRVKLVIISLEWILCLITNWDQFANLRKEGASLS